jgi:hypothetical protein
MYVFSILSVEVRSGLVSCFTNERVGVSGTAEEKFFGLKIDKISDGFDV